MTANRSIKLGTLPLRLTTVAVALLLLAGTIFVLRGTVANSAAARETNVAIAELSVALAPHDPQTHYALARLHEKSFLPGDAEKALREYEIATALNPHDFRLWLPYAKALERSGDIDRAENALRRALSLAPNYAQIRWALGNILLRQGKTDEAFAEIRQAVEKNPAFAATAAVTALQFAGDDTAGLAEKLGGSPDIQIALALGLARQKKFDESRQVWNRINEGKKSAEFEEAAKQLLGLLLAEKQFRYAFTVSHLAADFGKVANPGFESEFNITDPTPFEWRISDGVNPRIGFDNEQKHGGARSLGVFFAKGSGKDFRTVSQMVVTQSDSQFRFSVFVRSDLQSTGRMRFEIVDAGSGALLGATEEIPQSANEFTPLTGTFHTPPGSEGIVIRLARSGCENCSIEGKLWLDDVSLDKLDKLVARND